LDGIQEAKDAAVHEFAYQIVKGFATEDADADRILVLDGERLVDTWVGGNFIFQGGEQPAVSMRRILAAKTTYSSGLLSTVPIGELLAEFEFVDMCVSPSLGEFVNKARLSRKAEGEDSSQPMLVLFLDFDLLNWARPFSPAEMVDVLERVIGTIANSDLGFFHGGIPSLPLSGFRISLNDLSLTIADLVSRWRTDIQRVLDKTLSSLAVAIRRESLVTFFEFPPSVKAACQQYLIYFVQFLSDLGIEADAELKEDSHRVLFSITPQSGHEALGKISEALEAYLHLPLAPDMVSESTRHHNIAVFQLQANVDHLKSQLALASADLQAKHATIEAQNATIEALELSKFQYRQLVQAQGSMTRGPDQLRVPVNQQSPDK